MPSIGDSDIDDAERLAAHAEPNKEAWKRTLNDMVAMAEEREANNWETVVIPSGHTAPESLEAGEPGRWGLVHVIPGNKADAFREAHKRGEFSLYNVYRAETETRIFLVTELLDPPTETAIYIAGNFRAQDATNLTAIAAHEGKMYTHVQKLDTTHLGSFEHKEYEKFFPQADRAVNNED